MESRKSRSKGIKGEGEKCNYTLETSHKSDFQSLTTKSNNILFNYRNWANLTLEVVSSDHGGFVFLKNNKKILIRSKKSKLIHYKAEKIVTSIKTFLRM